MCCYEKSYFLGSWNLGGEQGTLSIEKSAETYKCNWKMNKEDTEHEYIGIGILVDNQLLVSRFSSRVSEGGVALYRPIGDSRSIAALWASMQNFNVLGSGIALREESSENIEGNYKVTYYIEGTESPTFDLRISKSKKNDVYSLYWYENDQVEYHGIGVMNEGQMPLVYGRTSYDYELVILSYDHQNGLRGKCALLSNGSITEEVYTRY